MSFFSLFFTRILGKYNCCHKCGGTKLKMDSLITILILEDMRRNSMNVSSQDALHVQGKSKEKGGPKGDKKRKL